MRFYGVLLLSPRGFAQFCRTFDGLREPRSLRHAPRGFTQAHAFRFILPCHLASIALYTVVSRPYDFVKIPRLLAAVIASAPLCRFLRALLRRIFHNFAHNFSPTAQASRPIVAFDALNRFYRVLFRRVFATSCRRRDLCPIKILTRALRQFFRIVKHFEVLRAAMCVI